MQEEEPFPFTRRGPGTAASSWRDRAWQRLEQLILGQVRSPEPSWDLGIWEGPGESGRGLEGGVPPCAPPSFQLEELKQQLEHQEEELGQLRLGVVRLLDGGLDEGPKRVPASGKS